MYLHWYLVYLFTSGCFLFNAVVSEGWHHSIIHIAYIYKIYGIPNKFVKKFIYSSSTKRLARQTADVTKEISYKTGRCKIPAKECWMQFNP